MTPEPASGRRPWHEETNFVGCSVLILGNSPSVTAERVQRIRHHYDVVIGVNRICRVARVGILVVADIGILECEHDSIAAAKVNTVWAYRDVFGLKDQSHPIQNVVPFVREFDLEPTLRDHPLSYLPERKDMPLARASTTPAMAVQMAVLAGADSISLLGVDHNAPDLRAHNQPTHAFALENMGPRRATGGSDTKRAIADYKRLLAWATSNGVECRNLSPLRNAPFHEAGWPHEPID